MRIVAARAGNFAFAIRHMGRALQLRAPHLMALQADLRLCLLQPFVLCKWLIVASVRDPVDVYFLLHLMAVHARYAA